jgi:hypothetical protein
MLFTENTLQEKEKIRLYSILEQIIITYDVLLLRTK